MANIPSAFSRASFAASRSGAAGVEAAFVLPILLACMLFVVEFGRILYSKVEFEYALNSATRLGMVQTTADAAAITKAVKNHFVLLRPEKLGQVKLSEITNADNSRTATLTASYKFEFLVPVTKDGSITLTRTISFLRM